MYQTELTRIIDFHTHTFPDKIVQKTIAALESKAGVTAKSDGTLEGLMDSMRRSGIDLSVIMPVVTRPEQFQTVNNFAAQVNEKYGDCVISFGGIHPSSQNYKKELNYIKSLGLKGIKLHPDYQGTMVDDIGYKHIIDYASQLDMVIVTHAGIDIGIPDPVHCPPVKSLEIIEELQPPKLVLAHMGGWKQWDEVEEYLAGKNVYLDCAFCSAYMSSEQFERIVRKHGADKILFATDSPWEDPCSTIKWVESTSLSGEEKKKIYMQNACELLGIRPEFIGKK
ncbi:MAG: metal-dependent hydrolase [Lachnospiraceae bacterium]|nr:metal-dependent hydrolase [Lachnospiraceae bacterium]